MSTIGIKGYGAYVPFHRLGAGTVGWKAKTEKAVANFDEDSITMAVAAAMDCLDDKERENIDGLYLATTTPPYQEKQGAAIVAEATDLRRDLFTVDCTGSLRSGTMGLRLAMGEVGSQMAREVLVAAADMRPAQPYSDIESSIGDGAAALVVSTQNLIAVVEGEAVFSQDILDTWRLTSDQFVRSTEERFANEQGYVKATGAAVRKVLERGRLSPKDFTRAIFFAPTQKVQREIASSLGFDFEAQVRNHLYSTVGNTGAAFSLMMLVCTLEEAKPGDRILLSGYGDGADAFVLTATDLIANYRKKRAVSGFVSSKCTIPDYITFARWKGLIDIAPAARRPALDPPAPAALFRERDQNIRLLGARCANCGCLQYPPQRVCTRCRQKDHFEASPVRFSDKRAKLFTYSKDYTGPTLDPPLVVCFINFEGGGRMQCMMTDRSIDEVKIGMDLEMTFRKLHTVGGVHNYFWKCMPARL